MGIVYRHFCVPEKLTIYDDRAIGIDIDSSQSPASRLYRQDPYFFNRPVRGTNIITYFRRRMRWHKTLIDLVGPMRTARDREPLYLRTDSHWTFAGMMIAYRKICKAVGARAHHDFPGRRPQVIPDYVGDLGGVCDPPFCEHAVWQSVERNAVRVYASPIVEHRERNGRSQTLHRGAHVIYRNDKAIDPRRVILFGDSFSHFAPIMLTIMLAETFAELHFVWSVAAIDWNYVNSVKPNIVLTEMAERFLGRLPDDNFDLATYARERFGEELAADSDL